jgi:hypothetical protein
VGEAERQSLDLEVDDRDLAMPDPPLIEVLGLGDRSSTGQRRAAAIRIMRGSGLTTNGLPTAASSGVS